ncbi:MAG: DNA polymerase I, partial [Dehalococcoidales bacterium]|nr:DNA polymerase I [Dehalococcoidales bacterium]
MEKPLLVLFDGNAIVHRAYHAFAGTKYRQEKPLTVSKTGEVVSAVYGFAQMLLKVLSELRPTHYAIAFDKKGPTFRHEMFDGYKAQRPATPEELTRQIERVKQLVQAFRIPVFEVERYEADDVLGTLSRLASARNMETVIVTGDADTMQLVSPLVKVLYPRPGRSFSETVLFDEAAVREKYGIPPSRIADLKALVGDPSDNIPGVPGIGDKTAVKLINEFGSLEGIYEHLDEVAPPRLREALREHEATARRSKELATIVTAVPLEPDLEAMRVTQYDRRQVTELFRELEFYSLLSKLPETIGASNASGASPPVEVKPLPSGYRIITSIDELGEVVGKLARAGRFAFDTETTGPNAMTCPLVGISLCAEEGGACYIPVGHTVLDKFSQLPLEEVLARLRPLLEDERVLKYAHNAKFDMMVFAEYGITVRGLDFDTMIAAHLLGEKNLGLKALAFGFLGVEMMPITALIGSGARQISMSEVPIEKAAQYSGADADMAFRLAGRLAEKLDEQGLMRLFREVEMPLVPVLLHMERTGVAVDTGLLREMSRQLGEQIRLLEDKIYAEAKHPFNINSPQQLGRVLFEEMQLPYPRRGKSRYSTEAAVLEELAPQYPFVRDILEYRQLTKIKSTYVDALPELINPKTGRIHTNFNQTRTTTGRLSSSDPNLQNIPVRGELGGQVRQAFVAPTGALLLGADYSQIDLRALAHLSQDENLIRAFREGADIHAATASCLFGVPPDQVTKEMRRFAKTVNFGVIYGMSDYGLEQATEFSREEAARFIKAYFERYPGVKRYLEETKEKARRNGYVETLLGRRRYIPDINSSNRQVREAAERMAINMPVQGTSAD